MVIKKRTKFERMKAVFVGFLMSIGVVAGLVGNMWGGQEVYAEPVTDANTTESTNTTTNTNGASGNTNTGNNASNGANETAGSTNKDKKSTGDSCKVSLGALGWIVCPMVNKISEAVDWLYGKIEEILVINPVSIEEGSPIYEIWKYCRGVTNIVFIIFLLVVIYSQLTGWGISNYGIKKALPKLIVMAVMVNLSFLICSLAVDASNIIGNGLRGVFMSVEEAATGAEVTSMSSMAVPMADMYVSMAGGTALAVGAALIAFETGTIWMLIPVVLGAIVAVVSGLITIALRQAVVVLLVMISPLAFVANVLPNTEGLFQKWKRLLIRMLVFYPMFSLLFGASSLAGFAIMASAKDGFGLMLGVAVQIFPLFFSWSLMRMSGTILGDINTKLRSLAARPIATNRAWADSRRQLARAKTLAKGNPVTPSARLMQYLSNRRIAREEEIGEMAYTTKQRGLAYAASRNYRKDGTPTREGEEAYERQARSTEYARIIEWHKNNLNKGLGQLEVVKASTNTAQKARLKQLDIANVTASDSLKMEISRGAKIDYTNAKGYFNRVNNAMYANADLEALENLNTKHQSHGVLGDRSNIERYGKMKDIMEGVERDTGFVLADAAHTYNSQAQIVRGKFGDHFDNIEATQDIVNELNKLTRNRDAGKNIDPILAGIRTLSARGDTDLAQRQLNNVLSYGQVEIGSHALQAISKYCMFDVKGSDPTLRRFGKYINLETAKMYNEADPAERRTRKDISIYEYINGEYIDRDAEGNVIYENGQPKVRKTRKSASTLLKGTSFKDMERTAIMNLEEMIRNNSVDLSIDGNGNEVRTFNYQKFKDNEAAIWNAIMPNVIGDHFSFLSGSEQIVAMSKGITGVDLKKHGIDWEGIFGKDVAASLTPEQKKDYVEFMNARTKAFLGGQVPAQIARTKSDMLEAIRNQYALKDALDKDEGFLERMAEPGFKMTNEEYKAFEDAHMDGIKEAFVNSFKKDALKGFVKMHHKGYQGEAKDGLIKLLDPDALYREYFPNGEGNTQRRGRRDDIDDDDDGAPIGFDDINGGMGGAVYNGTRSAIESVYDTYRGVKRMDVGGFWSDVRSIIQDSDEIVMQDAVIDNIENRLSQYTDVSTLYTDIMSQIFGGFDS